MLQIDNVKLWELDPPGFDLFSNDQRNIDLPSITPYLLQDDRVHPVMIICPGGGFQERMSYEGEPVALWLNTIGINAFVLNYRVAPYPPPTSIRDAVRAVRYIRYHAQKFRIDPERIGMIGFSAGGYITAVIGTDYDNRIIEPGSRDEQIRSIFVQPEDLTDPVNRTSAELNAIILCYGGTAVSENEIIGELPPGITPAEFAQAASPYRHVSSKTPPAFIWVTADDEFNICPQNLLFTQALSDHGIPYEFHVFAKGGHGMGLAKKNPAAAVWTDLCANWLDRLWPGI